MSTVRLQRRHPLILFRCLSVFVYDFQYTDLHSTQYSLQSDCIEYKAQMYINSTTYRLHLEVYTSLCPKDSTIAGLHHSSNHVCNNKMTAHAYHYPHKICYRLHHSQSLLDCVLLHSKVAYLRQQRCSFSYYERIAQPCRNKCCKLLWARAEMKYQGIKHLCTFISKYYWKLFSPRDEQYFLTSNLLVPAKQVRAIYKLLPFQACSRFEK